MCFSKIFTEPVVLSMCGGLMYQLFPFIEYNKDPGNKPDLFNKGKLGAIIIHIIFSGVIGYAYFADYPTSSKMLALHVGVSTPIIMRALAAIIPKGITP